MDWRSIVFSSDSKFCLYASDGRTRVRRRSGERHLLECIMKARLPHLRDHGVRGLQLQHLAILGVSAW